MSTISPRACRAQETPRARKASVSLALPIKGTYVQICFIALLKKCRPILVIFVARILIISLCFVLLHSSMSLPVSSCDSAVVYLCMILSKRSVHPSPIANLTVNLLSRLQLREMSPKVSAQSRKARDATNRHKSLEDINRTMPSMPSVWPLSLSP
jgi:hypothetical protein